VSRSPAQLTGVLASLALAWALLLGPGCTAQRPLAPDAFVILIDAAPGSLDPRFAISDYGAKISQLIFSSLVTTDTETGAPELDLAERIENPEPTVYEVTLREGVRFHDGHPLTTADVLYTFGQLGADNVRSPRARAFDGVGIVAIDERRVRFELPEPNATFVNDLAMGILPAHLLADQGTFGDDPLVGSGPFRWIAQRGELEVVLAANADYYGTVPAIDLVSIRLVRDQNARTLATIAGTADLVQNAIPPMLLPVVREYPNLVVESAPSFKYTYVVFNCRHPILSDVRVRQAIAYALDREEIIAQKLGGLAQLSTGLLAPGHWAYEPDVRRYDHDLEQAAALLDEAGFPAGPDGTRFSLVFKISADKTRRAIAEVMAHQLGRVGIDVEVQSYEWGTFFADVRSGNFALASLQWPNIPDPDHYRYIFHSENIPMDNGGRGANRGAYENTELDELLERGRRTLEREERRAIYSRVQQIAAEEVPYVSLWHEDNYVVRRRGLEGYRMVPNARFRYLTEAHWSDVTAE
jgi:peptide/nickel transport system substrate-binding protein